MIDMGYTFLAVGADVIALSRYCRDTAENCGIEGGNDPVGSPGK